METIELTQTVQRGGCAAKLPAGTLRKFLSGLSMRRHPDLLVGTEYLDDAAVWALDEHRALVQTLDFFTPVVNDAYEFGAIAAANALSDVYAMGGSPFSALTILAYPMATLPEELLGELMRGANDKLNEAQVCLVGGHSIEDDTLKLGFSVSGFVDRAKLWANSGARVDDILILTKGLGTGTITSAIKNREAPTASERAAIASMMSLNRVSDLLGDAEIHAATDITGFGLVGHSWQMAQASQVSFQLEMAQIPAIEGAIYCLSALGSLNRAHRSNEEYVRNAASWEGVTDAERWLTLDAQTSGGLLLAVSPNDAETLLRRLKMRFPFAAMIGRCVDRVPARATIQIQGK